ncbi:MAG: hypothetical protein DRN20_06095 [Thermoplasmata archaeon]|nr:MAG: hypothetical protein DRN20_06095 [Thermoplasmata archaeon]
MTWIVGRKIKTDKKEGTTTDDWATIIDEYCGDFVNKLVLIKNTGDSNSLDYRIVGDLDDLNEDDVEIASGSLTAGSEHIERIPDNYYKLKVYLKSTSAGANTDYLVKINFQA